MNGFEPNFWRTPRLNILVFSLIKPTRFNLLIETPSSKMGARWRRHCCTSNNYFYKWDITVMPGLYSAARGMHSTKGHLRFKIKSECDSSGKRKLMHAGWYLWLAYESSYFHLHSCFSERDWKLQGLDDHSFCPHMFLSFFALFAGK